MLTEQDKAIGRTVLREIERSIGHRFSALDVQVKQLQRKVQQLEQELEKSKRHGLHLEQALVKVAGGQ